MAKHTVTQLVDDLDGGAAESTVSFGWNGSSYEIDLSKKNIAAFEKVIAPYVAASRKVTARTRSAANRRAGGSNKEELQAIREWARKSGYEVADRGRISAAVVEAYNEG